MYVCFLLGVVQLWDGNFYRHEEVRVTCKEVRLISLGENFARTKECFSFRFFWFHHFAHVPCKEFQWRQVERVSILFEKRRLRGTPLLASSSLQDSTDLKRGCRFGTIGLYFWTEISCRIIAPKMAKMPNGLRLTIQLIHE